MKKRKRGKKKNEGNLMDRKSRISAREGKNTQAGGARICFTTVLS